MQYTIIILTLYKYAEVVWRDGLGEKNFVRRMNSSIYVLFANLEIPVFFVVLTDRFRGRALIIESFCLDTQEHELMVHVFNSICTWCW